MGRKKDPNSTRERQKRRLAANEFRDRRKDKRKKPENGIVSKFEPRFWEKSDSRLSIVRTVRSKVEALRDDCGADSAQKDLLVQRAAFIAMKLETMEINAVEGKDWDYAVYIQAVNSLVGLLKVLGLERTTKKAETLEGYIRSKKGKSE